MATRLRFGTIRKHPDSTRIIELDWLNGVANFWQPGKAFANGEYIRPRAPTGFSYQAGAAGQSGKREPVWPTTLGLSVVDGSITWTATAAATNGITPVTAASEVVEVTPSGLTTVVAATGDHDTQLQLSGGADGTTYRVEVTINAGATLVLVGSFDCVVTVDL